MDNTIDKEQKINDRLAHLEVLETNLFKLTKQYKKYRGNKELRVQIYKQIKSIINTMYYFPELHISVEMELIDE